MRLFLDFDRAQDKVCRARLSYAFQIFCAMYGHSPVRGGKRIVQTFGSLIRDAPSGSPAKVLKLPRLYTPRSALLPAASPTPFEAFGEATFLFAAPNSGAGPDWLGEIFEWLSCADEYSCKARDAVARLPFLQSYMGRHGLSPIRPYAAIAMRGLQAELQGFVPAIDLRPHSPAASPSHFIVNTHDVDYMRLRRAGSVKRLLKNAAISLAGRRCTTSASAQVAHAIRVAGGGPDPLDQLSALADGESRRRVGASYFFIARQSHRRDANYSIRHPKVVDTMHSLERRGMEVGVHGSYTTFDRRHRLMEEFQTLQSLGFNPQGHRAHWLRFTMDRLVDDLEATGALYDSSLGWSDTIGFRAGACFAFPLYNFSQERPTKFLELPLVGMDQCLCGSSGRAQLVDALGASRKYGWGGVSVLWHPSAFGGGQFRKDVGEFFWQLVESNAGSDSWVSGLEFVKGVQSRYREVGLLGD